MIATINMAGISFNVDYDHQPKEAETLTYPGCPESVEINVVVIKNVNVTNIIKPYWIGRIKEELMEIC